MTDTDQTDTSATGDEGAGELRRRMVEGLLERGELSAPWRPALEQVARHLFIPDTVWRLDPDVEGPDLVPSTRTADPQRWLRGAYANAAVFTQVDDGYPVGPDGRGQEVTSSASQPAIVAQMLTALEIEPGMRVLEIGTGTGWNAALLAHRVGAANVVSIEVDETLAERARATLIQAGYGQVTVVVGDGAAGCPAHGPYDRVLATAGVRRVPRSWAAQTRPGGVVLAPWGSDWYTSALLRLVVGPDGRARGRIVGDADFMLLREQRSRRADIGRVLRIDDDIATTTTDVHPWHLGAEPNAATAIGLRLPGVSQFYREDPPIGPRVNVVDPMSRSWARVRITDAAPYPVEQAGTRRLWDEAVCAYKWWRDQGEPARHHWIITVDQDGQNWSPSR